MEEAWENCDLDLDRSSSVSPSQLLCISALHGLICLLPAKQENQLPSIVHIRPAQEPQRISLSSLSDGVLSYQFRSVTANRSTKALLLYGDHSAFVCAIPSSGYTHTWGLLPIQEDLFVSPAPVQILKAAWHPLSSRHLGLLIKRRNQVQFLLYDVSISVESPEQTITLNRLLPGGHDADVSFTSFCFSEIERGWNQFSVYFLTDRGQVFMMCPLVPHNMLISQESIDTLSEDDALSPVEAEWIKSSFVAAGESMKSKPTTASMRPQLQGPLVMDVETYEQKATRRGWNDLVFYAPSSTDQNAPSVLIRVHAQKGMLHFLAQILPSAPYFSGGESPLIPFDIIDLLPDAPPHSVAARVIVTPCPTLNKVFVHHWNGAYRINLAPPSVQLGNMDEEFGCSSIASLEDDPTEESVLGLVLYTSQVRDTHSVLLWTSSSKSTIPLSVKRTPRSLDTFLLEEEEDTQESTLPPRRPTARERIAELKTSYHLPQSPNQIKLRMKNELGDGDSQEPIAIAAMHQAFLEKNHIAFLQDAKEIVSQSVTLLQEDRTKWEETATEYQSVFDDIESTVQEQRKRLNAFKEEQKRLEMRLSILFRLLNYAQPRLSPYEKRFFGDELGSFEERTREFQRLTDQLSTRVQSSRTVSTPQHISLSKKRVREAIQQALPTHTRKIGELQAQLQTIEERWSDSQSDK